MVMFGIANGPLAWAAYIFRNSLVFHDVDKMTSVYIHTLPMFLTYGLVVILGMQMSLILKIGKILCACIIYGHRHVPFSNNILHELGLATFP